jgi:hypothetical protein
MDDARPVGPAITPLFALVRFRISVQLAMFKRFVKCCMETLAQKAKALSPEAILPRSRAPTTTRGKRT